MPNNSVLSPLTISDCIDGGRPSEKVGKIDPVMRSEAALVDKERLVDRRHPSEHKAADC
jgi:hypothetical protein